MVLRAIIFVICCFATSCILVESRCVSFETITNNLREVVIGKCEVFQQMINQDVFCDSEFRNCTDIWEKFSSAFLYKPLCNVSESGYEGYINLTDHPVPRDKAIFWENVYPFVHRYSHHGMKYSSLSDTLTGYIGNGINWCSDPKTTDGLKKLGTLCPGWEPTPNCPQSALRGFWMAASKRFAEKASGDVFVMLNASTVPIYANTTYLAEHEMPFLRRGEVTKVTVLLVNESPVRGKTKCDDPSLQILADQMKAKNFAYDCVENRRDLAELLCLQDSSLGLCSTLFTTNTASLSSITTIFFIVMSSIQTMIYL